MAFTIENYRDRIRTILGVDDVDLPDAVIDYPEYYDTAVAWVKSRVPEWESLDEAKTATFKICILYKTATLLIPFCQFTIDTVKSEQTTHVKIEKFETDRNLKYMSIRDTLEEYLSELAPNDGGGSFFFGFDVSGRRQV